MTKPLLILILLLTGCEHLSSQVKQAQKIAHEVQLDYRNEPDINCIGHTAEIIRRGTLQGIKLVSATFTRDYHKAVVWFDPQGKAWVIDSTGAMCRWVVALDAIYEETGFKLFKMGKLK